MKSQSLWKFGGLTPLRLTRMGVKKMGEDELSTRASSLSYYFLLALFPMFVFLLSIVGLLAQAGSQLRDRIMVTLSQLAPGSASDLVHQVVSQTLLHSTGLKLAGGVLGALWAASGGMGAIITSLNVIYRTPETRSIVKQKLTVLGLTLGLALLMILALVLAIFGGQIGQFIANHVGLGMVFRIAWKILQWPVMFGAMLLSYSLVYYWGPNLEERKWHWVTPGASAGVAMWLIASLGLRVYLHFFNSYSATYGSLGAVVILMLWLYITGFAILVGGEVNWVIENEDKKAAEFEAKRDDLQRKLDAAA